MSMPYQVIGEPASTRAVLVHELSHGLSRRVVTVAADPDAAQELRVGTILGFRLFGAPTVAAKPGNQGNGTLDAAALGRRVMTGSYEVVCLSGGASASFAVISPDGLRLRDAGLGAYLGEHLAFTISAGGTAFAKGDGWIVTVPEGDGKAVPWQADALDGTGRVGGVLITRVVTAPGQDAEGQAVTRDAVLVRAGLIIPPGGPAVAAAALAGLAARGLVPR
jgi:hypothetical protein